jgi:hypothetical protein
MTTTDERVEMIARVIDPEAFARFDAYQAKAQRYAGHDPVSERIADDLIETSYRVTEAALAKAHTILALLPTEEALRPALSGELAALEGENARLRASLEKLIEYFEADAHDAGSFDADCPDCIALQSARAALKDGAS